MKKFINFFAVLFLCLSLNANAQTANTYSYSTSTSGVLDPMTGSTQLIGTGVDDTPSLLTTFPGGFSFTYEGIAYTQFTVTPDGFCKLGAPVGVSQFTNSITSTTNRPKVFPIWDDFATGSAAGGGKVHYLMTGNSPNRIFIIEWFVTIPRAISGPANSKFQLWLYESAPNYGGKIEFVYGTMGTAPTSSVGINSVAANPTNFQSVTISSNTVSTTTANDANNVSPASGRVYTFTAPPPPVNDVGISANVSPVGSVGTNFPVIAPKATVKNYGSGNQTSASLAPFPVTYTISGPAAYSSTKNDTVSAFLSNTVTFDSTWLPNVAGTYNIVIYTSLANDENRNNDTLKTTINVVVPIVTVNIANVEPVDTVNNGYTYAPKATFTNAGNVTLTNFNVNYQISGPVFSGTGYSSTKNIATLLVGGSVTVIFDSTFTPVDTGIYNIDVTSSLGDIMPPLAASLQIINREWGVRKSASCDYWWSNSQSSLEPSNRPSYSWKDPNNAPNKVVMINNAVNQLTSPNKLNGSVDDGHYLFGDTLTSIGKCIRVCGVDFNGFYPGTNGAIGLTNNNTAPANMNAFTVSNSTGPNAGANHATLLPFFKDLNFSNAAGQPPNRFSFYISKVNGVAKELVITWENVCIYEATLVNVNYVSFQACIELVDCGGGANSNIRYSYNFEKSGSGFLSLYGSGTPPTVLSKTGLSGNGSNLVGIRTQGGAMYYRKDSRTLIGGAQFEGPLFTTSNGDAATGGLSVEFGNLGSSLNKLNSRVVSVKVWVEGYRMSGTALLDTFKISIRNSVSPYSILETISAQTLSSGRVNVLSGYIYPGSSYYLMVNQRNSINTWTKIVVAPVSMLASDTLSYDLTTAITQAFGDNEVVVNGAATMYSGDVDKNGAVESGDLAIVDNDVFNFVTGYKPSDVNGDNQTDSQDMSIVDNNAFNFVTEESPSGPIANETVFFPKLVPDASEIARENAYAIEKLKGSEKTEQEKSAQGNEK